MPVARRNKTYEATFLRGFGPARAGPRFDRLFRGCRRGPVGRTLPDRRLPGRRRIRLPAVRAGTDGRERTAVGRGLVPSRDRRRPAGIFFAQRRIYVADERLRLAR